MLWSQRRNSGAHGAENSIQISALAGVEPRTWTSSDVATRLPRTPPFSRLLRHAGGYSRTILTPNLQGSPGQAAVPQFIVQTAIVLLLVSFQHEDKKNTVLCCVLTI